MARLVVMEGAQQGTVHDLLGKGCVLGRDLGVDLPLLDDRCSRQHARVEPRGIGWAVVDLQSRNGTFVNDLPVQDRPLVHGDRVRVGGTVLLFADQAAEKAAPPPGPTLVEAPAPILVGDSRPMQELTRQILRAAAADTTTLVVGETGTGKELVARALHANGPRRDGPFVAVNCAAFAEGLVESELFGHEKGAFTGASERRRGRFEQAHTGTLFLDEVGELPQAVQPKFLRVLESRELTRVGGSETVRVDVRVVAATNRDLAGGAAAGSFRQDLYYRLRVLELRVPPLRERPGDVRALAAHFLEAHRRAINPRVRSIHEDAFKALERYPWPGNVRELRNALERAVLLADGVELVKADLPIEVQVGIGETEQGVGALREIEKREILRALKLAGGNKTEAARLLGVHRATLYNKLREYGMPAE